MRSILVIRLSSLGDVILATPLVRQLRATFPDAVIDVAVAERFAHVWANNPRVNRVFAVPAERSEMCEKLPSGPYDLIVDLQSNARSRALRSTIRHTAAVKLHKHRVEKLALVYLKKRPAVVTPITDRYRQTVAALSICEDQDGPEVWLPEDTSITETVKSGAMLRIAIAPGAHHFTKRWPADRFVALCRGLRGYGATPVLVGGVGDVALCASIAGDADCGVEDRSGSLTVQDTARVLDTCSLIVTNDTGVMHLATARRLPVVAIFGSTTGDLGFAPYGVPHTIVEHDIACRPCSHIGRSTCPRGHFLCMNAITADAVFEAAIGLLQAAGASRL